MSKCLKWHLQITSYTKKQSKPQRLFVFASDKIVIILLYPVKCLFILGSDRGSFQQASNLNFLWVWG